MPTNALIHEASPYLLQHAHNLVNWLPWGDAVFEQARERNKPVFLSIGYAACHWCHVMEHESFEDEDVAAYLNEHFVSVKVDREERPDVDHYYMQAVQALTGQGGWPLSAFLTLEGKVFYGGTYWPRTAKWSKPGFLDVLRTVAGAWGNQANDLAAGADELHGVLQRLTEISSTGGELSRDLFGVALRAAEATFDPVYGGFGTAPKFPHPLQLALLLRLAARGQASQAQEMVLLSLRKMARGGIYDQIGGGFHRYSTDGRWLVPHFEKMLYDNALLAPVYLDAAVLAKDDELRRVGKEILDWTLREIRLDNGGFASSLDADSEGEEGKFYVWTAAEVHAVLGDERGRRFCRVYDVNDSGNFERGRSIPNLVKPVGEWADFIETPPEELEREIADSRWRLFEARAQRVRPGRDDKVLADWNGMMISALVRGYAVLADGEYFATAGRAADRLLKPFEERGVLVHSQLGEQTKEVLLLLDYAATANGLLDLFLATGESRWLKGATALAHKIDEIFSNPQGPFYMSASAVAGERFVDPYDNVTPAGPSLAGNLMARLYYLTDDEWYLQRAEAQVRPLAELMRGTPSAFPQALITVDRLLNPPAQLVLVGDTKRELWRAAQEVLVPGLLILWHDGASDYPAEMKPLLEGKTALGGKPTAYLCEHFTCRVPMTSAEELRRALAQLQTAETA